MTTHPYRVPVGDILIECEKPKDVLSLLDALSTSDWAHLVPRRATPEERTEKSVEERISLIWLCWAKAIIARYDLCEQGNTLDEMTPGEVKDTIDVFLDKLVNHRSKDDVDEQP